MVILTPLGQDEPTRLPDRRDARACPRCKPERCGPPLWFGLPYP